MELLANSLNNESLKAKSGVGIKSCAKYKRIPGLLVVDDCLLFYKADTTACWRIKRILDTFCDTSGQLINYHKSTLIFSKNASSAHRHVVASIFSITHSDLLGKYLGYPVF